MADTTSTRRGRPPGRSDGLRPVPRRVTACRRRPLAPVALRLPSPQTLIAGVAFLPAAGVAGVLLVCLVQIAVGH